MQDAQHAHATIPAMHIATMKLALSVSLLANPMLRKAKQQEDNT